MLSKLSVSFLLLLFIFNSPIALSKSSSWYLDGAQWNKQYELKFQEFVKSLGQARKKGHCYTTDACIKSKLANPMFANSNPSNLKVRSDCADLPFVLRAYFSWANNLPFSYPSWPALSISEKLTRLNSEISHLQLNKPENRKEVRAWKKKIRKLKKLAKRESKKFKSGDIRYSRNGNVITSRITVKNGDNLNKIINDVNGRVSTASFRIRADKYDTGTNYQDFYPVKIDRKAIVPGTVLYDPSGHIAVVYNITDDGRILLIDAHPDQSLTHITYGKKFSRSSLKINGGFKNWRGITLTNGGIEPTSNSEYPYYSLEQFIGSDNTDIRISHYKARYFHNGKELNFYDYVRAKMFKGEVFYNPMTEVKNRITELCEDFKSRGQSVNSAIKSGISRKTHPSKLPANIYGTSGEWETYSTPSRDARFKTLYVETFESSKKFISMFNEDNELIRYSGMNLKEDIRELYIKESKKCNMNLTLSDNSKYSISLYEVGKRLFKLSFDPYQCIELRWGLTEKAAKSSVCQKRKQLKWYQSERKLRNQLNRDYSINTAYSYSALLHANVGVETVPITSFSSGL